MSLESVMSALALEVSALTKAVSALEKAMAEGVGATAHPAPSVRRRKPRTDSPALAAAGVESAPAPTPYMPTEAPQSDSDAFNEPEATKVLPEQNTGPKSPDIASDGSQGDAMAAIRSKLADCVVGFVKQGRRDVVVAALGDYGVTRLGELNDDDARTLLGYLSGLQEGGV